MHYYENEEFFLVAVKIYLQYIPPDLGIMEVRGQRLIETVINNSAPLSALDDPLADILQGLNLLMLWEVQHKKSPFKAVNEYVYIADKIIQAKKDSYKKAI